MSTKAVGDLQGGIRGDGWSASSFLSPSQVTFRPKGSNSNSSTGRGSMSPSSPATPGLEARKGTVLRAGGLSGLWMELFWGCHNCQAHNLLLSLLEFSHYSSASGSWWEALTWFSSLQLGMLHFHLLGGRCFHSPFQLWLLSPHFVCYLAEWTWKPTEAIFTSRPRKGIWNSTQFHI